MDETVTIQVNLNAFVRRDTKSRWIAVCPAVGVASQGSSPEKAKRALDEAVQLWFESCIERGVLERALQEANFRRLLVGERPPEGSQHVTVSRAPEHDELLGEGFQIHVQIPAYEAAALMETAV